MYLFYSFVQLYIFRKIISFVISSLRFIVFCSSVQTMQTCLTVRSYGWNHRKTEQLDSPENPSTIYLSPVIIKKCKDYHFTEVFFTEHT